MNSKLTQSLRQNVQGGLAMMLIISLVLGPVRPAYAQNDARPADNVSDDEDAGVSSATSVIGSGYLLHITSAEDSKLNGDFRVSMDGTVALPYDMSINAAGMKVAAFKDKLEKTYQPYFKSKPKMTVTIKQRKYWVRVLGLVKSPGPYLVNPRSSLDEVLAMAQVRTEDLPNGYVRISTGNRSRWISMDDYLKGGKNHELPAWQGKEVVLFQTERPEGDLASKESGEDNTPSSRKIQILGEVKNPGAASYQRNADGYYYLIQKGGPTSNADLTEVELLRRDRKTNEHVRITKGEMGNLHDIQEADVIIVHPARQTSLERFLQNTGVVAAIVSAVAVTALAIRR